MKNNEVGYLYCIYNKMYDIYGENIFKLGNMKNKNRMNGYVTSYIDPVEIKLISNKIVDKNIGEKILFDILSKYRIKPNREFFNCELSLIKNAMDEVETIMKRDSIDNLRDMYLPKSKEQIINNMIVVQQTYGKDIDDVEDESNGDDITDEMITNNDFSEIEENNMNDNENNVDYKIYNKYKIHNKKLEEKLKIQLTPEIIKKWYKKEYILDNALCALGKKQYNDDFMGIKIEYLNNILNIFGFKGLLDFDTKVEFNKELEKKMIDSGLLTKVNYSRMMRTFGKQERANEMDGNFEKNKFMKLCNCIVNEFGMNINSKETKRKQIKKVRTRTYEYCINEELPNIYSILSLKY